MHLRSVVTSEYIHRPKYRQKPCYRVKLLAHRLQYSVYLKTLNRKNGFRKFPHIFRITDNFNITLFFRHERLTNFMKKKQRRVKRPRGEIKQRFDEQLSYLSFAADGYDTQDHSLIKMATAPLRTLFLKQNMGEPLIEQLKIDPEKTKFMSSVALGEGVVLYGGPVIAGWGKEKPTELPQAEYLPLCYNPSANILHSIPFEKWWNGRLLVFEDHIITRKDIVRYVANQDGGAHVDRTLVKEYDDLLRGMYSANIFRNNMPKDIKNIHLALLRQLVDETIRSFEKLGLLPQNLKYDSGSNKYQQTYILSEPMLAHILLVEGDHISTQYY
ncbi:hypothetical protein BLL69_1111c [Lacticaseibacillus paracasei]|nr:hypothetical protein BLL69_1111c [Lacticaseibacillus paracasei]